MRFIILRELPLDDIPFLKGKYSVVSGIADDEFVYEAEDSIKDKLKVFEEAGYIKEVKGVQSDIESVDDIIRLTEKVALLQGGEAFLRVKLLGHELEFRESQLLSPKMLEVYLIRLRKFLHIPKTRWTEIIQYWLSVAEDVEEISEEEEIKEKVLNYLKRCVIYTDIQKSVGRGTLFYSEETPKVVYCLSSHLTEMDGNHYPLRRIRWLLRDYLAGSSIQKMVGGERRRYWQFLIEKTGIELEKAKWREGDKTILEIERETVENG
jgi:hypothetical protein